MEVASVSVAERACRRNTCDEPARVSLVFDYSRAQAWLIDLVAEPHPLRWDLCPVHADALSVPRGWELVDDRSEPTPPPLAVASAPSTAPGLRAAPDPRPAPESRPTGVPSAGVQAPTEAESPAPVSPADEAAAGEEVPGGVTIEPGGTLLLTKPARGPRQTPALDPRSRYAPLLRALPRLAAEHAAREQQAAQGLLPASPFPATDQAEAAQPAADPGGEAGPGEDTTLGGSPPDGGSEPPRSH